MKLYTNNKSFHVNTDLGERELDTYGRQSLVDSLVGIEEHSPVVRGEKNLSRTAFPIVYDTNIRLFSENGYSAYMDDTPLDYSCLGEGKTVEETIQKNN